MNVHRNHAGQSGQTAPQIGHDRLQFRPGLLATTSTAGWHQSRRSLSLSGGLVRLEDGRRQRNVRIHRDDSGAKLFEGSGQSSGELLEGLGVTQSVEEAQRVETHSIDVIHENLCQGDDWLMIIYRQTCGTIRQNNKARRDATHNTDTNNTSVRNADGRRLIWLMWVGWREEDNMHTRCPKYLWMRFTMHWWWLKSLHFQTWITFARTALWHPKKKRMINNIYTLMIFRILGSFSGKERWNIIDAICYSSVIIIIINIISTYYPLCVVVLVGVFLLTKCRSVSSGCVCVWVDGCMWWCMWVKGLLNPSQVVKVREIQDTKIKFNKNKDGIKKSSIMLFLLCPDAEPTHTNRYIHFHLRSQHGFFSVWMISKWQVGTQNHRTVTGCHTSGLYSNSRMKILGIFADEFGFDYWSIATRTGSGRVSAVVELWSVCLFWPPAVWLLVSFSSCSAVECWRWIKKIFFFQRRQHNNQVKR